MTGRVKRDHWSTKEDPFRIPDEGSWSPPAGATGPLINLDGDANGHPESGFGINPQNTSVGSSGTDWGVTDFGAPQHQPQFQGQQQPQPPQGHHMPVGPAPFPVASYPTYYSPNNYGTNPGNQFNHPQSGTSGMKSPPPQADFPPSPTDFGGGTWQQLNPMGWNMGSSAASGSSYGPELHGPQQSELSDIYTSDEDDDQKTSSGNKNAKSPNHSTKRKLSTVQSMRDLTILGKWELLNRDKKMHKYIETYVRNSSGMRRDNGSVKIHQICQLTHGWKLSRWPNQMMLWFKTTPRGIRYLGKKEDGCIAFYDRLARALAIKPERLEQPLRQIILLCTVSVGNMYESKHGHSHWTNRVIPRGFDVIKGVGRLEPVERENEKLSANLIYGETLIPCGSTRVNRKFKSYELEFSEYLVYEASRIKVDYAVDIELVPKGGSTYKQDY